MKETISPERKIVLPGDLVSTNPRNAGSGTYIENGKVYAKIFGLLDEKSNRVIPLKGKYIPEVGNLIIGIIEDVQSNGWVVDINSPYEAFLPVSEYPKAITGKQPKEIMDTGDVIAAKVVNIDPMMRVYLSMKDRSARILHRGRLIEILHTRVPRVIGRKGSMVSLLKKELGVKIIVGQNGRIWVDGPETMINFATDCIQIIEKEAHTDGLTERITSHIKKLKRGV
jgi:exosome complex component RRP4